MRDRLFEKNRTNGYAGKEKKKAKAKLRWRLFYGKDENKDDREGKEKA